jgi:hypothetical protein
MRKDVGLDFILKELDNLYQQSGGNKLNALVENYLKSK